MIELIIVAAFGALAVQLLNLLELPKIDKKDRPNFKDWAYYIPYVVNPLLGAFIAYVYIESKTELNTVLAMHIGASAPVILKSLASSIPNKLE